MGSTSTKNLTGLTTLSSGRLVFLRRLDRLLKTFYQSVVESGLFFAVVCLWSGTKTGEVNRLNKLVRLQLDSLETVADRRMKDKIKSILDNPPRPLHDKQLQGGSTFSHHIILPRWQN